MLFVIDLFLIITALGDLVNAPAKDQSEGVSTIERDRMGQATALQPAPSWRSMNLTTCWDDSDDENWMWVRVYDEAGILRLIYPTPTWQDLLSLAIDEIRFDGANSYQVMRRLRAMLADLEHVVPPERYPAIHEQVERLERSVERTFVDSSDQVRQTDRQGIGLSRHSTYRVTTGAELTD